MATKKSRAKAKPVAQPAFTRAWKHYGLRTSKANGESYGGFVWPETGMVECPDWKPDANCGNGLHALLNGEGDAGLLTVSDTCRWQAVGFDEYVDLGGKVKFPRCEVVTGTREQIGALLQVLTNGAVHYSTATAGDWGTATAGYSGTATAGDRGTATAGDWGTATAGDRGTATAGDWGTATAGNSGSIQIKQWDDIASRYRIFTAYVGENGIKAGVAYKLDASGNFVEQPA